MTKPTIQIGHEVREMTDEEIAQHELDKAEFASEIAEKETKEKLKKATLKKLGLTENEIAALLS